MRVTVFLSSTLRPCVANYTPHGGMSLDIKEGITVAELAQSLQIPLEDIKVIMVNHLKAQLDQVLQENDRVSYFPPVGGG